MLFIFLLLILLLDCLVITNIFFTLYIFRLLLDWVIGLLLCWVISLEPTLYFFINKIGSWLFLVLFYRFSSWEFYVLRTLPSNPPYYIFSKIWFTKSMFSFCSFRLFVLKYFWFWPYPCETAWTVFALEFEWFTIYMLR